MCRTFSFECCNWWGTQAALLLLWPEPGGFILILQKTATTDWSVEGAVVSVYWLGTVCFLSLLVSLKDLCLFLEARWLI